MGWLANILFVLGIVAVGNKSRSGFAINALANLLYAAVGAEKGMWDLIAISLFMTALDVYYFHQWGKADGKLL